jgi:hypothetical protein
MWYESLLICTHFIPDKDSQSKHAECCIRTLFYSVLYQYFTVSPYTSKSSFHFLCLVCQVTVSKHLSLEFIFLCPDNVIFYTGSLLSISSKLNIPQDTPTTSLYLHSILSSFRLHTRPPKRQTLPFFLSRSTYFFIFVFSPLSFHIPLQH